MALLFPLLLLRLKKRAGNNGVRLPPGPWQLPVIGSLHHLLGNGKPFVHRALAALARRLLMYLKLGEVLVVVATSPDAGHEIMRTHDVTFATRPWSTTMRIMMADGYGLGFAPYGDQWRQLRKISVLELLTAPAACSRSATSGRRTSAALLPPSPRHRRANRFERREEFLETIEEESKLTSGFNLSDLFPSSFWFVNFFVSGTARRSHAMHQKSIELMDHAIKQHEELRATMAANGRVVEEDLVDVLLRIQKEGGLNVPLTKGTIKATIFDLFGAGSKTSAITLQWAMSELIRNPNVMKKAQAELSSILNGKPKVTEDDLDEVKYLKLVIKETLRLHPAAPLLIPRESRESCKILGYDVPKGTTVLVSAWAIGRDPKYWEDADEFKPERFESTTVDFRGTNFEYIPFGAGRSPGILFAQANIELVLAALLYHFALLHNP
ncbi:Cytochrome P450 71D10 [Dichanthelium oligosanthes]|uniref:Cytochrome P450 71D10 n=1 Tax=Dichanthelium oligosanthes TaxID=888268 RepID=A0A1E5UZA6_9POAL|nr:Cytochrome P450 71D10 [Dichanthelium oligosanthes]